MPGQRAHEQVRRGLSRASATTAAASTSTSSSSSRSTARRRCSAPSTPTSSRTPARRPTRPSTTRCWTRATRSWASRSPHGGHLTHGMKINVSGKLYDIAPVRGRRRETHRIDMDEVERIARERKPEADRSPAGRRIRAQLDFARFREIADEVGALLMVDMAHFAGLVAAGLHPSPVPYADVVTTTIHKTIGGAARRHDPVPRGVRQEDQLGRVPRPAGRPARARDRRQGGRAEDRRVASCSASASSARSPAPRPSPRSCSRPATA